MATCLNFVVVLHLISATSFVLAAGFLAKLLLETDRAWYWKTLVLAAVALAASHLLTFGWMLGWLDFVDVPTLNEFLQTAGGVLLAVSGYALYANLRHIREKVE